MRLALLTVAALLTACGPRADNERYLVRACGDGTRIYADAKGKNLEFSSALAAGKIAPDLTADQVCNGLTAPHPRHPQS
ncbi:hypothetical protein [Sphingomonas sp. Ant20]|uniref:hypothetical protein n=1 Tax=Sphingomonas sp. Ant20 TaxID=104605 RepID=UPI00053719F7|nr:hypothetical protein [Sphingomonas sp. Ant20]KHA63579.1 hypothetical protein NI18_15025 [Sphingomonas sp. Ant20]